MRVADGKASSYNFAEPSQICRSNIVKTQSTIVLAQCIQSSGSTASLVMATRITDLLWQVDRQRIEGRVAASPVWVLGSLRSTKDTGRDPTNPFRPLSTGTLDTGGEHNPSLGKGVIAGVVVSGLAAVICIVVLTVCFLRRRRRRHNFSRITETEKSATQLNKDISFEMESRKDHA
jgi:hypothetical protein